MSLIQTNEHVPFEEIPPKTITPPPPTCRVDKYLGSSALST